MAEKYSNSNHNRELSMSKAARATMTAAVSKPSLFSRSMTIHAASAAASSPFSKRSSFHSSADRSVSGRKWYESAGTSFKGKVKQLRTLFETPKSIKEKGNEEEEGQPPPTATTTTSYSLANHHLHHHPAFSRLRPAKSFSSDLKDVWSILDGSSIRFPGTEDRVVVYFTSLRGVRRTFEDCFAVRMIFRGVKVFVDERDVSMDIAYRNELHELLKDEKNVALPQVFIKGRYVGGVDLIRQLNETGELRKILQVLPLRDRRYVCDSCGDVRFVPCSNCSGSRKIFDEDDGVVKRCLECNENGIVRCPECCL